MTDLTAKCPKCGRKVTTYIHTVDHFGMSDTIPDGKYNMVCKSYFDDQKPKDFCGHKFKVKVTNEQRVEVLLR